MQNFAQPVVVAVLCHGPLAEADAHRAQLFHVGAGSTNSLGSVVFSRRRRANRSHKIQRSIISQKRSVCTRALIAHCRAIARLSRKRAKVLTAVRAVSPRAMDRDDGKAHHTDTHTPTNCAWKMGTKGTAVHGHADGRMGARIVVVVRRMRAPYAPENIATSCRDGAVNYALLACVSASAVTVCQTGRAYFALKTFVRSMQACRVFASRTRRPTPGDSAHSLVVYASSIIYHCHVLMLTLTCTMAAYVHVL